MVNPTNIAYSLAAALAAITLLSPTPTSAKSLKPRCKTVRHFSQHFNVTKSLLHGSNVPFIPHTEPGFGSYLAMNLDYTSVLGVVTKLNETVGPLQNRGEAHITIVTPPEYNNTLKAFVSIEEINEIARDVQEAKFKPLCVGRGSQVETKATSRFVGERSSVYYIPVESDDLTEIRRRIGDVFVERGGDPSNFDPDNWAPHITLAFQDHDWFPENGVFKTVNTCFAGLKLVE
ncbi:hypothetical protein HK102_010043 [Quaeritorhiza haematococci]|nr:hypothetical protein HK102_010043 [Quaeritorhiza haematococci]